MVTDTDIPRWLAEVLAREDRKARTRALRAELATARAAGKQRRHADRLARLARESAPPKGQPK